MTSLDALLADLQHNGIRLWHEAGRLRFRAPKGALTEDLRGRIKHHKKTLLTMMRDQDATPIPVEPSPGQRGLWLAQRVDGAANYNESLILAFEGDSPHGTHLNTALTHLVNRHETLRYSFPDQNGEPGLVIAPEVTSVTVTHVAVNDLHDPRPAWLLKATETPFDIARGPLFRFFLATHGRDALLVITLHHLIADAWSGTVLLEELSHSYNACRQGSPINLPPLQRRYADYAASARQRDDEAAGTYWRKRLNGLPPLLPLPTDHPRPARATSRGDTTVIQIDATTTKHLKQLAASQNTTLFCVLAAVFSDLLGRYSGCHDIALGTTLADRPHPDDERLIGYFINTVVLRTNLAGNPDYGTLIKHVQNDLRAAMRQVTPFEKVVEAVKPPRDPGHSPLFQVMLVLHNTPTTLPDFDGLRVQRREPPGSPARYDLTLFVSEEGDVLNAKMVFNRDLFEPTTLETMLARWSMLLAAVTPSLTRRDLPLTRDRDTAALIKAGKGPVQQPNHHDHVLNMIAEKALTHGNRIAVLETRQGDDPTETTYTDLLQGADRLAQRLRAEGVGPESIVAVHLPRSRHLITALLAVWRAGGAYVIVDPSLPTARKALLIEEAKPTRVLAIRANLHQVPGDAVPVLCVDTLSDQTHPDQADTPIPVIHPQHLAYVLFTSGSTGTPKGVAVSHGALRNYLAWAVQAYAMKPGQRVPLHQPLSFDATITSLWGALASGACLEILPEEDAPARLRAKLADDYAWVKLTPAHLRPCLPETAPKKPLTHDFIIGGEQLQGAALSEWRRLFPQARFINEYGPTEATVGCCIFISEPGDRHEGPVPIGRPIANTRLYVLDEFGNHCAPGLPGELYIAGESLARGYWGRPRATAEAFRPDPYGDKPGARMYRSGDRVRYLVENDGSLGPLLFLERADHQLKINGYRIEPGEIETALLRHPQISQAAVLPISGKQLGVRFTCEGEPPTTADLRRFLSEQVPHYMVPACYEAVDSMPMTPHGKIDRKTLTLTAWSQHAAHQAAPTNPTMVTLVELWRTVLKTDRVGIYDNFFGLGGDSISAVRFVSEAAKAGLTVSAMDVFRDQTIAELAERLERRDPTTGNTADRPSSQPEEATSEPPGPHEYPLTPLQQGMVFVGGDRNAETVRQACARLQESLDLAAFQAAWTWLIQRHQTLRTGFVQLSDGRPRRIIQPSATPNWETRHLPAGRPFDAALQQVLEEDRNRAFDLQQPPLMRFTLIQAAEPIFVWTYHQALLDGWSIPILFRELVTVYQAIRAGRKPRLPTAPDYVRFEGWLENGPRQKARTWWRGQLAGMPSQPREPVSLGAGSGHHTATCCLGDDLPLAQFAAHHGITLNTLINAAWAVLLARYRGTDEAVYGTVFSHRPAELGDSQAMIGLMIHTVPVRVAVASGPLLPWLKTLQQQAAERQAQHPLALHEIHECSPLPGDRALFDNLLIMRNFPDAAEIKCDAEVLLRDIRYVEHTGFPLNLIATAENRNVTLQLQWRDDCPLLAGETMLAHLAHLLKGMIANPQGSPQRLSLLSMEQQHHLAEPAPAPPKPEALLHEQFRERAKRAPQATALLVKKAELERISYQQLAASVDRLTAQIAAFFAKREAVIAIFLPRSERLISAVLATLEAGTAFLLLDPDYPDARLRFLVEDADTHLLITDNTLAARPIAGATPVLNLDTITGEGIKADVGPRQVEETAYVIYTSGSSGQPKGIETQHHAVINRLTWMWHAFPFEPDEICYQKTALCFVDAVWELFGGLLQGIPTYYADNEATRDARRLLEQAHAAGVTRITVVPSLLRELVDHHSDLLKKTTIRIWVASGETLPSKLATAFYRLVPAGTRLINLYGSSEVSADVSCYEVPHPVTVKEPAVPIGTAISGSRCLVMDGAGNLLPDQVPGRLFIGGVAPSRCYHKDPRRTAARFVPDPFGPPGSRLFDSGDRVVRDASGKLHHLGRADHLVKRRGVRIECGELERLIEDVSGGDCAVVLVQNDQEEPMLVAMLCNTGDVDKKTIHSHLAANIPTTMMPDRVFTVPSLPLTPNGKRDRIALQATAEKQPALGLPEASRPSLHSATEESVAQAWSLILDRSIGDRHTHFFEQGGNSLKAMRVAAWFRNHSGREIGVRTLFDHPRLCDFAHELDRETDSKGDASDVIPRLAGKGPFPCATMQRRLWLQHQAEDTGAAYHIHGGLRVDGPLHCDALRTAWIEIVQRHPTLRTRFVQKNGHPMQVIDPVTSVVEQPNFFHVHDCRSNPKHAASLLYTARNQPFDPAKEVPFRLLIMQQGPHQFHIQLTLHHLIIDGWSLGLLLDEWLRCSRQIDLGPPPSLRAADWAAWQVQRNHEDGLRFWHETLAEAPNPASLPIDKPRGAKATYAGTALTTVLDKSQTSAVHAFCLRRGATPFMVLHAAFAWVLGRYAGSDDVMVGVPVANRDRVESEGLVGFFTNTIVLRSDLGGNPNFETLVDRVRSRSLAAFQHQAVPYEKMVEIGGPNPLFRVMFLLQNTPLSVPDYPGLDIQIDQPPVEASMFDLTLNLVERRGTYHLDWITNRDLFEARTVRAFADCFHNLLTEALGRPQESLTRWDIQPCLQGETTKEPRHTHIAQVFEELTAKQPDATALLGTRRVTRAALNRAANGIAQTLIQSGLRLEEPVAVCLNPDSAMIAALLGVLKAGGAYLPLDAGYPPARLELMLRDSGARFLLVDNDDLLADTAITRINPADCPTCDNNPNLKLTGLNLATLIYTSGSSGTPKGVLGTHHATLNRFTWMWRRFPFRQNAACCRKTALSFVDAVWEIFGPLLQGVPLLLLTDDQIRHTPRFVATLAKHRVTRLLLVPSQLNLLLAYNRDLGEQLPELKLWFTSGETLPLETAQAFAAAHPTATLINLYGSSEAAGDSSFATVVDQGVVLSHEPSQPIGTPISNTHLRLEHAGRTVPPTATGELFIGGHGLARGYHGNPAQTAQNFVPDPDAVEPGARRYRTGDFARTIIVNGKPTLLFQGRVGGRLKIRGRRIEPAEIENCLCTLEGVTQAGVCAVSKDDGLDGDALLVAHVVAINHDATALRRALAQKLPDFMVPDQVMFHDSLPQTPNGKRDRQALAALPLTEEQDTALRPPRNELESELALIWGEVLDRDIQNIHADFFQLGGHSLAAMRVAAAVHQLTGRDLPLRVFFQKPTLAEQAAFLADSRADTSAEGVIPRREGNAPLTFAQQRLWFLHRLEGASATYNMPFVVTIDGDLDSDDLSQAFALLADRHEVLRTCFPTVDGQPVQQIRPEDGPVMHRRDLRREIPDADFQHPQVRNIIDSEVRMPFDLEHDVLLRLLLLRIGTQRTILVGTLHHIIGDDWSVGVLVRDLTALYASLRSGQPADLPPLKVRFSDFAFWQQQQSQRFEAQGVWWRQHLAGAPLLLNLPTDRRRPAVQRFHGDTHAFQIEAETVKRLKKQCFHQGVTPFVYLRAVYAILLQRLSSQDDLVIGSPIAGRNQKVLEPLVGFFANTLALRCDLSGNPRFTNLLSREHQRVLTAFEHQDMPFERIVEQLCPQRNLGHSPLFQAAFVLQNAPQSELRLGDLQLSFPPIQAATAKFDLTLFLTEREGVMEGVFEYAADLFLPHTIRSWTTYFKTLLEETLTQPDLRINRFRLSYTPSLGRPYPDTHPPAPLLTQRFTAAAARFPSHPALADAQGQTLLCYRDLDAAVNRLTHRLLQAGVGPETLVGLHLRRSPRLITAALATTKAGGAFVPLDPGMPRARCNAMVEGAQPNLILIEADLTPFETSKATHLALDDTLFDGELVEPPASLNLRDSAAYVLFTSGSTGRPKGVVISQHALADYLDEAARVYGYGPDRQVPLHSTIGFDATITALWTPLVTGATVCIVPEGEEQAWLAEHLIAECDIAKLTPAHLDLLAPAKTPDAPRLTTVVIGGEILTPATMAPWRKALPETRFFNEYGPTEATVGCALFEVGTTLPEAAQLPIGTAMSNTRLLVLDEGLNRCPAGVPGRLFLCGEGLARGYHNQPARTAERFVPNPYATGPADARMYDSGDRARILPCGRMEVLGRLDDQLKIRGYRIEPGEVVSWLRDQAGVADAWVTAAGRGDHRHLAAYLTEQTPGNTEAADNQATLDDWRAVFDTTYNQKVGDAQLNLLGWTDSFTGTAIDGAAMREWVAAGVDRIRARRPKRILEIGCGTGLLLFRLAPTCTAYHGVDLSAQALQHIETHLDDNLRDRVTLHHGSADDLPTFEPDSLDAVILHSVVQYFPTIDYLSQVLAKVAPWLSETGFIFIGDVRPLPLQNAFHTAVCQHGAAGATTAAQLKARARARLLDDPELVIDPTYFQAVLPHIPQLKTARIEWRRGVRDSEMTRFRYDAVLGTAAPRSNQSVTRRVWSENWYNATQLLHAFSQSKTACLVVENVPNRRLSAEQRLHQWLSDADADETLDMWRRRKPSSGPALDPETLWQAAHQQKLDACITPSEDGFHFHVALSRNDASLHLIPTVPPDKTFPRDFANHPQTAKRRRHWIAALREAAKEHLPAYMVPAGFTVLEKPPLTPNGKLDRHALPQPHLERMAAHQVPPRNAVETRIAAVWETLLGHQVGVHTDFFNAGGHSLLATRVLARLNQQFNLDLPLQALFQAPTIAGLAEKVQQADPVVTQVSPLGSRRPDPLPLAPAQVRLWFLSRFAEDDNAAAYHISFALQLDGELDQTALVDALSAIVERHEILRTCFPSVDETPVQVVEPARRQKLEQLPADQRDARIAAFTKRRFDLTTTPPLRFGLVPISLQRHILVGVFHHLIFDGWSASLFAEELADHYARARQPDTANPVSPLPLQYADYAVWQQKRQAEEVQEPSLSRLCERLADYPTQLTLPTDTARPTQPSYRAGRHDFQIGPQLRDALLEVAGQCGATLYMILLGGFAVLLHKLCGVSRLLVGTPAANRNRPELESLIGLFVNTLVTPCDMRGNPTFQALLDRIREASLASFATADIPFERLVETLQPQRATNQSPLFQVMFSLENTPPVNARLSGLELTLLPLPETGVKFDLTLSLSGQENGLHGSFLYATDLFTQDTIQRFATRYISLLEQAVARPSSTLAQLSINTAREYATLPHRGTAPLRETDPLAAWQRWVQAQPQAAALVVPGTQGSDQTLTYAALWQKADHLAQRLVYLGITPETRVAVDVHRGFPSVVAMLAVLRAGGVYMPIDPAWPSQRTQALLHLAEPGLMISQYGRDLTASGPCLRLDADANPEPGPGKPLTPHQGNQAAVILTTSGTTGTPKAIVLDRAALFTHMLRFRERVALKPTDRVLQFAGMGFDPSLEQILPTLAAGACIVQRGVEPWGIKELNHVLTSQGITVANLTTAVWSRLVSERAAQGRLDSALRCLLVGGEAMPAPVLRNHHAAFTANVSLINVYGPTEATVTATAFPVTHNPHPQNSFGRVPVGPATPGRRAYVLDADGNRQPIGIPGRLFLAGESLARAYLGLPAATAAVFVPNPFDDQPGARMYDTGDRALITADGNLTILGRTDHQVKLRGHRIECGEIEHLLCRQETIAQAVVTLYHLHDQPRLAAWLLAAPECEVPPASELQRLLSKQLPPSMIPTLFSRVTAWPLTATGKIDRRALPDPQAPAQTTIDEEPRNPTERFLRDMWRDLLKQPALSIHDDFFANGGHSLLATRIATRLQRRFQVEPPLRILFENPTVAALAAWVDAVLAARAMRAPVADGPDESDREEFEL